MSWSGDTRGVSITLSYVLTLGITVALMTGLLLSAGSLFDRQQERSRRAQLQDIGGELAHEIHRLDQLAATGTGRATVSVSLPGTVSGRPYSVTIRARDIDGDGTMESMLFLDGSAAASSVRLPVGNETWVEPGGIETGEFQLSLCRGPTDDPRYSPRGRLLVFGGSCP